MDDEWTFLMYDVVLNKKPNHEKDFIKIFSSRAGFKVQGHRIAICLYRKLNGLCCFYSYKNWKDEKLPTLFNLPYMWHIHMYSLDPLQLDEYFQVRSEIFGSKLNIIGDLFKVYAITFNKTISGYEVQNILPLFIHGEL